MDFAPTHSALSRWGRGQCAARTFFAGVLLFIASSWVRAADNAGAKVPPGSVPAFAAALAHFDLEIPVADDSGVVKIGTLTSQPAKGFAAAPGYGAFFWAAGAQRMIFSVPPN